MLRLRLADEEDLNSINELSNSIEFEQGIHNWTLYYRTSPSTFYVYEFLDPSRTADGQERRAEVVGYVTRNLIDDKCLLTHHIMILPQYRNQRLAKSLVKNLDQEFEGLVVANYNNKALKLVNGPKQMKPVVFGPKYIGYYGFLPKALPTTWVNVDSTIGGATVCHIDPNNIKRVLEFDRTLHPTDRSEFLRQWLLPQATSDDGEPLAISMVALEGDKVSGYGAVRMMTESYYDLVPAYADSTDTAERILHALATELWTRKRDSVELYVSFPAEQTTSLKFCRELGLRWHYAEMRTYENVAVQPQLPWHRVFSAHEFWLL